MNKNERLYSRNITLTSSFLNKNLSCHKGLQVGKLNINELHLGHKLGEFFVTKVLGERISYRKKQKMLLKRRMNRFKSKIYKKIKQ